MRIRERLRALVDRMLPCPGCEAMGATYDHARDVHMLDLDAATARANRLAADLERVRGDLRETHANLVTMKAERDHANIVREGTLADMRSSAEEAASVHRDLVTRLDRQGREIVGAREALGSACGEALVVCAARVRGKLNDALRDIERVQGELRTEREIVTGLRGAAAKALADARAARQSWEASGIMVEALVAIAGKGSAS